MSKLEHLDLSHTHVTDAGLVHLQGLTLLQDIWPTDTLVTNAGIARLKQALPRLRIDR